MLATAATIAATTIGEKVAEDIIPNVDLKYLFNPGEIVADATSALISGPEYAKAISATKRLIARGTGGIKRTLAHGRKVAHKLKKFFSNDSKANLTATELMSNAAEFDHLGKICAFMGIDLPEGGITTRGQLSSVLDRLDNAIGSALNEESLELGQLLARCYANKVVADPTGTGDALSLDQLARRIASSGISDYLEEASEHNDPYFPPGIIDSSSINSVARDASWVKKMIAVIDKVSMPPPLLRGAPMPFNWAVRNGSSPAYGTVINAATAPELTALNAVHVGSEIVIGSNSTGLNSTIDGVETPNLMMEVFRPNAWNTDDLFQRRAISQVYSTAGVTVITQAATAAIENTVVLYCANRDGIHYVQGVMPNRDDHFDATWHHSTYDVPTVVCISYAGAGATTGFSSGTSCVLFSLQSLRLGAVGQPSYYDKVKKAFVETQSGQPLSRFLPLMGDDPEMYSFGTLTENWNMLFSGQLPLLRVVITLYNQTYGTSFATSAPYGGVESDWINPFFGQPESKLKNFRSFLIENEGAIVASRSVTQQYTSDVLTY